CCLRGDRGIRAAAAGRNVCRIQHGDRPVSGPSGCGHGSAVAERVLYRHGRKLRSVARADQSDDLQYAAILQYRTLDCRGRRGCGSVVSVVAAAVALLLDAPPAWGDFRGSGAPPAPYATAAGRFGERLV